jgi:hypothetical protein
MRRWPVRLATSQRRNCPRQTVEPELVAVEAGDGVADRANPAGEGLGAAHAAEQQIGGGIVAFHDRMLGRETDAHRTRVRPPEHAFREGRIGAQIGAGEVHRLPRALGPRVHRAEQQLEGRAHGEAFVGAVGDQRAPLGVDQGDAEPAAAPPLDLGEGLGIGRGRLSHRARESEIQHRRDEPGQHGRTPPIDEPPRLAARAPPRTRRNPRVSP